MIVSIASENSKAEPSPTNKMNAFFAFLSLSAA